MERREFVRLASGATGASVFGLGAEARALAGRAVAPSDQISIGVIGVGSRGKDLMARCLRLPGVRIGALCDVYEPRFAEGREITGEATPVFKEHRRFLEASKDLDAVIVASPLSCHAEHMIASLDRGLHVYGEKALGHTVPQCNDILDAVRRSGRFFQIGHQYRYAPWYREAIRRIGEGEIGRVTHIYAYWHRNYDWRRSVPEPALERLINWRLYREYSGGLLAELGSHHIDVANWVFGEVPKMVLGNGGIDFYPDGRENSDNVQAIFVYPGGGKLVFSSLIGNHKVGYQLNIYGTGGTVELSLQDGTFFYEPARAQSAVPQQLIEDGVYTTASLGAQGDMPYRGRGLEIEVPEERAGDPNQLACEAFVTSLRENTRPFADEQVGWASGVPVALGNLAIHSQGRVYFSDHLPAGLETRRGQS